MSINIYLITNKAVEPNMYYVGQTKHSLEKRFLQHIRMGKRENNCLLYNALIEYGKRNFTIELLEVVSENDFKEKETQYIMEYKSHYKDGFGYNMKYEITEDKEKKYHGADKNLVEKNIGEGNAWNKGISFSEESKNKIKKTKKHRFEIGLYTKYGHVHTEETKKLLSNIAKSRPSPSEETRKKISKSSSGRFWVHSMIEKRRMFVTKEFELSNNWKLGKGTCWVNNGKKSISIDIWKKEKYINELGYVEGRLGFGI